MKTDIGFRSYLVQFFLAQEMFRTNVGEKNTRFTPNNFFFENRAVYKIMCKNTVQPDKPQITIWRMRTACCIPMLQTHTNSM
jgi:hypothetical protein